MTESFEIQRFVKTNEPMITVAYAVGREEASERFCEAIQNSPGEAFRMIQIICDFTTMVKRKPRETFRRKRK